MLRFIKDVIHTVKINVLGLNVIEYKRIDTDLLNYKLIGVYRYRYSKFDPNFCEDKMMVMYHVSNKTGNIYLTAKEYLDAEVWDKD